MTGGRVRVLIVDDHAAVAEGLALALARVAEIEVVAIAGSAGDAERLARDLDVDVVLMDEHLPDARGSAAAAQMRAARPSIVIVMLSGDASDEAMLAAVEAGAVGYLLKTEPASAIVDAITRAAAGEIVIPADTLSHLFRLKHALEVGSRQRPLLSDREMEILHLMADGIDTVAIAERLTLSPHTVRHHVQSILEKTETHSKLEAVARAHELGLLKR